jgi:hypothetical protein
LEKASEPFHRNYAQTVDFIEDLQLERWKKLLIPSHRMGKCEKWPIFDGFHEIPMGWL